MMCAVTDRWSLITITTVGYGDMTPVTSLGYVVGAICAISGTILFALTIPVLSNNFAVLYTHARSHERVLQKDTLLAQIGTNIRRHSRQYLALLLSVCPSVCLSPRLSVDSRQLPGSTQKCGRRSKGDRQHGLQMYISDE